MKEHHNFGPRNCGQRLGSDACSKFPGIFQLLFRQPSVEAQEPGESLERGFFGGRSSVISGAIQMWQATTSTPGASPRVPGDRYI